MGEVHLVAVPGTNVGQDAFDAPTVIRLADAGRERCLEAEGARWLRCRLAQQLDQPSALVIGHRGVEDQLAGAPLMVAHQRPGIQAQSGVRQPQVIPSLCGKALQAATEVIGEITDQSAREWQLHAVRRLAAPQLVQRRAEAVSEVVGRFVGTWRKFCQWPGAE